MATKKSLSSGSATATRVRSTKNSIVAPAKSGVSITTTPKPTALPLKGVIAMVDVRVGPEGQIDCSDIVARKLQELGAIIAKRFTNRLTHVVVSHFTPVWKEKIVKWQGGRTHQQQLSRNRGELHIVSQLWVNACYVSKQRMDERPFFPVSKGEMVSGDGAGGARSQSLGGQTRRKSLGAPSTSSDSSLLATLDHNGDKSLSRSSSIAAISSTLQSTVTTQTAPARNLNARKRKALSMEPMASDAILRMLENSVKSPVHEKPSAQTLDINYTNQTRKETQQNMVPSDKAFSNAITPARRRRTIAGIPTPTHESLPQQMTDTQVSTTTSECMPESGSEREADESNSLASTQIFASASTTASLKTDNSKDQISQDQMSVKSTSTPPTITSSAPLTKGMWTCDVCNSTNIRTRKVCLTCRTTRPPMKKVPTVVLNGRKAPTMGSKTPARAALAFKTPAKEDRRLNTPARAALTLNTPAKAALALTLPAKSTVSKKTPVTATIASKSITRTALSSRASSKEALAVKTPARGAVSAAQRSTSSSTTQGQNMLKRPSSVLTTPGVKRQRTTGKENTLKLSNDLFQNEKLGVDDCPPVTPPHKAPTRRVSKSTSTPGSSKASKTPRQLRAVIGITGVDTETRSVIECAIHAIDASMSATSEGHRRARVVKSVDYAAAVTHLIVGHETKRTIKVLFAIARGAWIVSESWVFSSLDQERWLPEEDFELKMFSSHYSRSHPESRQIFKGMKLFVGSNVDPSPQVLQSLIQCAGGEICNQISIADMCICGDGSLFRRAQRTGIRVVTSKWVFDSITSMKLEDDSKYNPSLPTTRFKDLEEKAGAPVVAGDE